MPNETDNLLADVRAAASELAGDDPVIETPVVETPDEPILAETAQQTADRARDEAGRFAKAEERKARETLKLREPKAARRHACQAPPARDRQGRQASGPHRPAGRLEGRREGRLGSYAPQRPRSRGSRTEWRRGSAERTGSPQGAIRHQPRVSGQPCGLRRRGAAPDDAVCAYER